MKNFTHVYVDPVSISHKKYGDPVTKNMIVEDDLLSHWLNGIFDKSQDRGEKLITKEVDSFWFDDGGAIKIDAEKEYLKVYENFEVGFYIMHMEVLKRIVKDKLNNPRHSLEWMPVPYVFIPTAYSSGLLCTRETAEKLLFKIEEVWAKNVATMDNEDAAIQKVFDEHPNLFRLPKTGNN